MVFTFHIVQIKRTQVAANQPRFEQFTFHIVQIKLVKTKPKNPAVVIYIPHSSDKTSKDRAGSFLRAMSFTFHIVQIKRASAVVSGIPRTIFTFHIVQIKPSLNQIMQLHPHLYIPHSSDKT